MDYKEACEWLEGARSMTNSVPQEPTATWHERIARADAAMMEQAYWAHKAHHDAARAAARLRAENERLGAGLDHIDDDLIKELNAQIAIVQNSRTETWENRPITGPNHNARYINECDRRLRVARAAILSKSIRLMEDSVVALASMDL